MLSQGHKGPVTSLTVQLIPGNRLLLASTAADDVVKVWECALRAPEDGEESWLAQDSWELVQDIESGYMLQHSLAVTQMPGSPDW